MSFYSKAWEDAARVTGGECEKADDATFAASEILKRNTGVDGSVLVADIFMSLTEDERMHPLLARQHLSMAVMANILACVTIMTEIAKKHALQTAREESVN